MLQLRLLGPFALKGSDGHDIALGRKSQALLAMVCLGPSAERSRKWLQDALWSDRDEKHGADSLRQTLAQIRRAVRSGDAQVLRTIGDRVALDLSKINVDVRQLDSEGWLESGTSPDLLEGIEVNDPEFEEWLRDERIHWKQRLEHRRLKASKSVVNIVDAETTVQLSRSTFAIGLLPTVCTGDTSHAEVAGEFFADWLARTVAEVEVVEILDYRDGTGRSLSTESAPPGPDLLLQCRIATVGTMVRLSVNAFRAEDRKIIWSQSIFVDHGALLGAPGENISSFVACTADSILSALASGRHIRSQPAHEAAKVAINAVHRLLTMTGPGLLQVERDLNAAYAADPKAIYLAWLAYMMTFRVGERYGPRDAALEEEARVLARRALEADPHNSLVLALVAHVHSYVFREFAFATDLISRAIELNPHRAFVWDSASLLRSYVGNNRDAMSAALTARRLGTHSPYRHLFDGACCVAAAMNGRFSDAARFGESVMAVQPEFKAVLRYLSASYAHLGKTDHANTMMQRLIRLEPDFSVERLRDASYPVPSRRNARLIEKGLIQVGLPTHPA